MAEGNDFELLKDSENIEVLITYWQQTISLYYSACLTKGLLTSYAQAEEKLKYRQDINERVYAREPLVNDFRMGGLYLGFDEAWFKEVAEVRRSATKQIEDHFDEIIAEGIREGVIDGEFGKTEYSKNTGVVSYVMEQLIYRNQNTDCHAKVGGVRDFYLEINSILKGIAFFLTDND